MRDAKRQRRRVPHHKASDRRWLPSKVGFEHESLAQYGRKGLVQPLVVPTNMTWITERVAAL